MGEPEWSAAGPFEQYATWIEASDPNISCGAIVDGNISFSTSDPCACVVYPAPKTTSMPVSSRISRQLLTVDPTNMPTPASSEPTDIPTIIPTNSPTVCTDIYVNITATESEGFGDLFDFYVGVYLVSGDNNERWDKEGSNGKIYGYVDTDGDYAGYFFLYDEDGIYFGAYFDTEPFDNWYINGGNGDDPIGTKEWLCRDLEDRPLFTLKYQDCDGNTIVYLPPTPTNIPTTVCFSKSKYLVISHHCVCFLCLVAITSANKSSDSATI